MLLSSLTKSQRLLIIIAISFSFFLMEIGVGFYTRALVLVADAFHYLNDLVGYVVAYAAFKVSERSDAPKVLPFGWQRATLLGAFFNGVFLMALGVSILLQSIERFVSLERVQNPKLVLIVGCVGLALNILSATIIHEHSPDERVPHEPSTELEENVTRIGSAHGHDTHRHKMPLDRQNKTKGHGHDLGLLGVLLHVIGDAANNVGVIIAATVIWKAQYAGRFYADPAVSMGIAVMIILSSLPLMKRSGSILMQSTPVGVDPDDVKHDLETIPGVIAVHDLHIWLLNQQKAVASAHVVISDENTKTLEDFTCLANTINECFHAYGVHSATLQPEIVSVAATQDCASVQRGEGDEETVRRRILSDSACRIGCRTTACDWSTCCD